MELSAPPLRRVLSPGLRQRFRREGPKTSSSRRREPIDPGPPLRVALAVFPPSPLRRLKGFHRRIVRGLGVGGFSATNRGNPNPQHRCLRADFLPPAPSTCPRVLKAGGGVGCMSFSSSRTNLCFSTCFARLDDRTVRVDPRIKNVTSSARPLLVLSASPVPYRRSTHTASRHQRRNRMGPRLLVLEHTSSVSLFYRRPRLHRRDERHCSLPTATAPSKNTAPAPTGGYWTNYPSATSRHRNAKSKLFVPA